MAGRTVTRLGLAGTLLAFVLAACSADTGVLSYLTPGKVPEPPPPDPARFPDQYKSDIADFMRTYLNNPTRVKDAFVGQPVLRPVGGVPHYVTCVRYNPRDSRDQYEGEQTNFVVFLSGKPNQFLPGNPDLCRGLNYQRYPEIESMVP